MMELTKLQEATKNHVLKVFEKQKCYLIADEVGLGKTIVAAEIIKELANKPSNSGPYIVYYICGNERVATQNCRKLREICGGKDAEDVRLSMQWEHAENYKNGVVVLPLTPATTFTNKNSEYNKDEKKSQNKFFENPKFKDTKPTDFLEQRRFILKYTFEELLKPDMILLDEFQNYSDLLYGNNDCSLFQSCLEQADKVLMLSATPYVMKTADVQKMDPFDDGLGLDKIKKNQNKEEIEDIEFSSRPIESFDQMVQFIDRVNRRETRPDCEQKEDDYYETVFCRSERSMFYNIDKESEIEYVYSDAAREKEHLMYTAELYARSKNVGLKFWTDQNNVISCVKECPAPASFATRYKSLKDQKNDLDFYSVFNQSEFADLFAFNSCIDPFRHGSLSLLRDQACPDGIEKLLWIPPVVFSPGEQDQNNPFIAHAEYTKSLVFGNYRFSTAAPACLLSELIRQKQDDLIQNAQLTQFEQDVQIDDSVWWPEDFTDYENDNDNACASLRALIKCYLKKNLDLIRVVTGKVKPEEVQKAVDTYAAWGDLKNVILEYAFLLGLPTTNQEKDAELTKQLNNMRQYFGDNKVPLGKNQTPLSPTKVVCFRPGIQTTDETELRKQCQMECGFAERFTDDNTDLGAHIKKHQETLQHLFNSPFYPFVIASTSVAQEGLDFHNYCHRIVHWGVAKTPVAYEQREGRIDRYLSHLMRKRIALCGVGTSFKDRLENVKRCHSCLESILGQKPLFPYWYIGKEECQCLGQPLTLKLPKFIRVICALPNSKESRYFSRLRAALKNYNYYIGPTY